MNNVDGQPPANSNSGAAVYWGVFGRLLPYVAALGSLFILGAMTVPGSPAMLPWPVEWIVLGFVFLSGTLFWFSAARIRKELPEETRRQHILDEDN